jgi:xanthine/CO dehydrogenase XdhC/CoxF family maturation factor
VSPIGIAGIGSKLPGAIAISIAAQLLQIAQATKECSSTAVAPLVGRRAS